MLIQVDLKSHIGCVRDKNEDMVLVAGELFRDADWQVDLELTEKVRLAAVVADGMGGHRSGEVASEMAAASFRDFVVSMPPAFPATLLKELIRGWAEQMHQELLRKGASSALFSGMGTTFCGLLFYESTVLAINIGDSRLYRYRDSVLKQISIDHSLRQLTGDITLPSNQIYNSLGACESVYVDIRDLTGQLFQGDRFLICSDGLSDMVSDEQIEQLLEHNAPAATLFDAARTAGGKDNISLVLITIKKD
ncbi:MAG: protein phosphatase 2C domain-containing protein [Proteiniphilum sp.]|nr:protein phosphatase 2C domain-containing protein [Proteiniphilum sp.]